MKSFLMLGLALGLMLHRSPGQEAESQSQADAPAPGDMNPERKGILDHTDEELANYRGVTEDNLGSSSNAQPQDEINLSEGTGTVTESMSETRGTRTGHFADPEEEDDEDASTIGLDDEQDAE